MKLFHMIGIVAIMISSILSCKGPEEICSNGCPEYSLFGQYKGTYAIIETDSAGLIVDNRVQWIDFIFSTNTYQMRWNEQPDSAPTDDTSQFNIRYFCDSDGGYALSNGVQFSLTNPNVNSVACNENDNPSGNFSANQSSDTLRFIQIINNSNGNSVRRRLSLIQN